MAAPTALVASLEYTAPAPVATAPAAVGAAVLQRDSLLWINTTHVKSAWFQASTAVNFRADGSVG